MVLEQFKGYAKGTLDIKVEVMLLWVLMRWLWLLCGFRVMAFGFARIVWLKEYCGVGGRIDCFLSFPPE